LADLLSMGFLKRFWWSILKRHSAQLSANQPYVLLENNFAQQICTKKGTFLP